MSLWFCEILWCEKGGIYRNDIGAHYCDDHYAEITGGDEKLKKIVTFSEEEWESFKLAVAEKVAGEMDSKFGEYLREDLEFNNDISPDEDTYSQFVGMVIHVFEEMKV